MQVVRTIVESSKLENIVEMFDEFKHQKVELLILPVIEKQQRRGKKFDPDEFVGILNIDEESIKKEIKSMRDVADLIIV
ncbi:MAG: hypothetical protein KAW12_23990 [Candidatus Aminicenantes bacterium]|nr:hypothetical protein [Candidatus Aminicenantes bacterium]